MVASSGRSGSTDLRAPSMSEGGRLFALAAAIVGGGLMTLGMLTPWAASHTSIYGSSIDRTFGAADAPVLAVVGTACTLAVFAAARGFCRSFDLRVRRLLGLAIVGAGAVSWIAFHDVDVTALAPPDYEYIKIDTQDFGHTSLGLWLLCVGGLIASFFGLVAILRSDYRRSDGEATGSARPAGATGRRRSGDVSIIWAIVVVAVLAGIVFLLMLISAFGSGRMI